MPTSCPALASPAGLARPVPAPRAGALPAVAALLLATVAWGSLFHVGRSVVRQLDPLWFTTLRYTLATAMLAALVAGRGAAPWAALRRDGGRLARFGLAGYGLFSLFVFYGVAHSVPSHGAVIMATIPFTTQMARWVLDGQRPAARSVVAAAVALLGVAGVAGLLGGATGTSAGALTGDAVTLLGTLGWVVYTRGAASMPGLTPLAYTALTAMAALPAMLAVAVGASAAHLVAWPDPQALWPLLPRLLYVAALPTVAAAIAFNFGVRRLGATAGTLFINVVPVSALAIGACLGQVPRPHEIGGAALVILALVGASWPASPATR